MAASTGSGAPGFSRPPLTDEQAWANTLLPYLNGQDSASGAPAFSGTQQGISTDWWEWGEPQLIGYEPDGTLTNSGAINTPQQAVYSQLQRPAIDVYDSTSNVFIISQLGSIYNGPVNYLQWQYQDDASDNLNLTATAPNTFLKSGEGSDALDVSHVNGQNVLDGGTGSNFLVGGTGDDTFFLDGRSSAASIWDTLVNGHAGDAATLWGVDASNWTLAWINDTSGAPGFTGLTGSETNNTSGQSITFTLSGYHVADESNGRLTISYGATAQSGTLGGATYMQIAFH